MVRIVALLLGLCVCITAAQAEDRYKTLPAYFQLPAGITLGAVYGEAYNQLEFPALAGEAILTKAGKHWHADFIVEAAPSDATPAQVWEMLRPGLEAQGWAVDGQSDGAVRLHTTQGGIDGWAVLAIYNRDDVRLDIVEAGPPSLTLVAAPPSPTPEKVSIDSGDFPYIPPLPNSELTYSGRQDGPLAIQLDGSDEIQLVGTGFIIKNYSDPPGISPLYFVLQYEAALTQSGWTILAKSAGASFGDGTLVAHYTRDGRDIWANLHDGGGSYSIQVADAGATGDDLASELKAECHVALYGVLFDFNKATLKPDSDSVLQRVFDLMQKENDLKLEVQGHTDNVGSDEYNQTLSEARARSVMDWLVARGIAPDRLTSKGYGESIPIASNDDDAGRARNRRVEIANQDCAN